VERYLKYHKAIVKCTRSVRRRERRRIEYNEKNKEVKRSLRAHKREWANELAREAEEAARNGKNISTMS